MLSTVVCPFPISPHSLPKALPLIAIPIQPLLVPWQPFSFQGNGRNLPLKLSLGGVLIRLKITPVVGDVGTFRRSACAHYEFS